MPELGVADGIDRRVPRSATWLAGGGVTETGVPKSYRSMVSTICPDGAPPVALVTLGSGKWYCIRRAAPWLSIQRSTRKVLVPKAFSNAVICEPGRPLLAAALEKSTTA